MSSNSSDKEGDSESRVTALRVAQSELSSGNTSGKVFMRLSSGSVAFPVERQVAEKTVANELHQALLAVEPPKSRSTSRAPNSK